MTGRGWAAVVALAALLVAGSFWVDSCRAERSAPAVAAGVSPAGGGTATITGNGSSSTIAFTGRPFGDRKVGCQIWGTWDGASVTLEMRVSQDAGAPFHAVPGLAWPVTADMVCAAPIRIYEGTVFRAQTTGAGAGTSLTLEIRD